MKTQLTTKLKKAVRLCTASLALAATGTAMAVDDVWTGGGGTDDWADTGNWNNGMSAGGNFVIATKGDDVSVTFAKAKSESGYWISTGLWVENIATSGGIDTTVSFTGDTDDAGLSVGEALTIGTNFGYGALAISKGSYWMHDVYIGAQDVSAKGSYSQSGGTVEVGSGFLVGGWDAGCGTATINGTASLSAGWLTVGAGANADGSSATIGGNATVSSYIRIGARQKGLLTVEGGAVNATGVVFGSDAAVKGTLVATGGTVNTPSFTIGTTEGASGEIDLNGGTLALNTNPSADNYGFIASGITLDAGANGGTVNVGDGGYLIAVNAKLTGSGEIRKTGTRPLTFANADFTDFTGTFKLNAGTLILPNAYTGTVSTDVAGYKVNTDVGETTTTYTFAKIPVTWQGDEGSNWNTPGNWDSGAVPTASDDVVIPANSTITLDAAAYAATITAGETVTIAASGYDAYYTYASGIKVALQNSEKWGGKFKISNINNTNSAEYNLGEFGNINSAIELNSVTWHRMKCVDPSNTNQKKDMGTLILEGTVKCTGTYGTSSTGGTRDNYSIWFANIGGRGSLETSGSYSEGQGTRQKIALGNGVGFSGSLTTKYDCVIFGNGNVSQGNIKVESNYSAGLGLGAIWNPSSAIDIAGTLKVQQGADATATTATLKAPTVTFENGATIHYAKLGTIALVDSSNEAIAPSGSGTVNIAFDEGVTLADGVQLMSWGADATPDNVSFVFSDSSLNDDWKLTASETGLVLNTKNPVASVDGTIYSNLADALAHASDNSSIVLKVNSTEAIALKGTQTLTIDSGVEYTGALTISSPTESEIVEPTLVLNGATTVASVTVGAGATFALPRNYPLLTGENALAIGGAGWVKFTDNNSSAYSAVAISVPAGTLEFAAGSTFKDIAAGTVYVSGTVTGTTLDAQGNIGNGSTLFTLTDGTFANATVTAYVNGANTAIHYTKSDSGVYTAGAVYYWIGTRTSTNDAASNLLTSNWSLSDGGTAASECPRIFDAAFVTARVAGNWIKLKGDMPWTLIVQKNITIEIRDGGSYNVGANNVSSLVLDDNVTVELKEENNGSSSMTMNIYGTIFGPQSSTIKCNTVKPSDSSIRLYCDMSEYRGTLDLVTSSARCYTSIMADVTLDNSYSKWYLGKNGTTYPYYNNNANGSRYSPFGTGNSTYKFGAVNGYVSNSTYANYRVVLEVGECLDDNSELRGSWFLSGGTKRSDYGGKVKWMAKTATFTQAVANAYEVDIMGGGYVYVEKDTTTAANFVPSVIKFLEFTDSESVVRKGGYLTIDNSNSEIAGDIVNAIAAAGAGETQAAAGFNVTADATAAVNNWSALAESGIVKKGDGTLTLTGTPSETVAVTVEAGKLVTPKSLAYTLGSETTKCKQVDDTYEFYKADAVETGWTEEITEVATQEAADAIAEAYVVALTDAQTNQGLKSSYYTVVAEPKSGEAGVYVLSVKLADSVKPTVAEGATVDSTNNEVSFVVGNLKPGLCYRVRVEDANRDQVGADAEWSDYYDGTADTEPELKAPLPGAGQDVLYYVIEASDAK